jgi:hypothetical protein
MPGPERRSASLRRPFARGLGAVAANLALLSVPSLALLALVLELFFRFVLPAAEVPHRTFDASERMIRFDTDGPREGLFTRGRAAEVRAHWRINDFGWNSDVEYQLAGQRSDERPLIAVIGDSYVNSFQVDPDENVSAVLRRELGGRYEVYRFGVPGAPLSHYLHIDRYVNRLFEPDIVVFNIVHNDLQASLRDVVPGPFYLQIAERDGALVEVPPTAPTTAGAPWWLRSATLRYLKITLQSYLLAGSSPSPEGQRYIANVAVDEVAAQADRVRAVVALVLERIREENDGRRVVFVMDAPRLDLYAGRAEQSEVRWLNELMAEACAAAGFPFLDLTTHFGEVFRARGEPFESAVDQHWNELGHREAGRALAAFLVEQGIVTRGEAG